MIYYIFVQYYNLILYLDINLYTVLIAYIKVLVCVNNSVMQIIQKESI